MKERDKLVHLKEMQNIVFSYMLNFGNVLAVLQSLFMVRYGGGGAVAWRTG